MLKRERNFHRVTSQGNPPGGHLRPAKWSRDALPRSPSRARACTDGIIKMRAAAFALSLSLAASTSTPFVAAAAGPSFTADFSQTAALNFPLLD